MMLRQPRVSQICSLLAASALASGPGCLARPTFMCQADSECDLFAGGQCQPGGYCSYPDGDCESGQKFAGVASPELAGVCVQPVGMNISTTIDPTTSGTSSMDTSSTGTSGASSTGGTSGLGDTSTSNTSNTSSTSSTGDASSTSSTGDPSTGSSSTGDLDCGDGTLQPGEECDDGDLDDKNQCSNACVKRWQWVFVAPGHHGNFGGISGADTWCQQSAQSAALPGDYRAWLSAGANIPDTGFLKYDRPYIMKNFGGANVEIATGWKDLVDGALAFPINADAAGKKIPLFNDVCHPSRLVWSNTTIAGIEASNSSCGAFTLSGVNPVGRVGRLDKMDAEWTDSLCGNRACSLALHVYCIEQ